MNNRMATPDAAPRHKALASGAAARLRDMRIERIYGSTLVWWLVWIIWIPVFIPNLRSHPGPSIAAAPHPEPGRRAALLHALLCVSPGLRADLASGSGPTRPSGAALWTPIVVMVALSLALTSGMVRIWGGLFIYASHLFRRLAAHPRGRHHGRRACRARHIRCQPQWLRRRHHPGDFRGDSWFVVIALVRR